MEFPLRQIIRTPFFNKSEYCGPRQLPLPICVQRTVSIYSKLGQGYLTLLEIENPALQRLLDRLMNLQCILTIQ